MKKTYENTETALTDLEKANCFDCETKIEHSNDELTNGVLLDYKEVAVYKCDDCYKKNPSLENYSKCEIYSRVVGYIRPISGTNPGKAQEIKERKYYKVD